MQWDDGDFTKGTIFIQMKQAREGGQVSGRGRGKGRLAGTASEVQIICERAHGNYTGAENDVVDGTTTGLRDRCCLGVLLSIC